jgi:hypothetical protein
VLSSNRSAARARPRGSSSLAKHNGALPGELSETGYRLPPDLTYERWASIGATLLLTHRAVMFWIGDWLRYGEARYGEKYAQAIETTDFAYQTLRNAVWVCEHVEMSRRRDNLSFGHHDAIAALDPGQQDELLERAAPDPDDPFSRPRLTVTDLRRAARQLRSAENDPYPIELEEAAAKAERKDVILCGASFGNDLADIDEDLTAAVKHVAHDDEQRLVLVRLLKKHLNKLEREASRPKSAPAMTVNQLMARADALSYSDTCCIPTEDAAYLLGVSVSDLRALRRKGRGPSAVGKIGGRVWYQLPALRAWTRSEPPDESGPPRDETQGATSSDPKKELIPPRT